jgi:hypothetical protein
MLRDMTPNSLARVALAITIVLVVLTVVYLLSLPIGD